MEKKVIGRIPSLDGIRAVAIIMVLLAHSQATLPLFLTNNYIFQFFADGNKGVQIFFVLSGYLITKLLIKERNRTGTINIKDFYLRRIYRIFPVFYLYILVLILLKYFFKIDTFDNYYTILIAALYVWNYHHFFEKFGWHESPNGLWFFGHFWTLAVEEQFYLVL